jgi:hypothetical protein
MNKKMYNKNQINSNIRGKKMKTGVMIRQKDIINGALIFQVEVLIKKGLYKIYPYSRSLAEAVLSPLMYFKRNIMEPLF